MCTLELILGASRCFLHMYACVFVDLPPQLGSRLVYIGSQAGDPRNFPRPSKTLVPLFNRLILSLNNVCLSQLISVDFLAPSLKADGPPRAWTARCMGPWLEPCSRLAWLDDFPTGLGSVLDSLITASQHRRSQAREKRDWISYPVSQAELSKRHIHGCKERWSQATNQPILHA